LTVDWARSAGLALAGYVINTLQAENDFAARTNIAVLRELVGPALGVMPFLGTVAHTTADRDRLADVAEAVLDLDALLAD
jgi:dethiobiotin synthetase